MPFGGAPSVGPPFMLRARLIEKRSFFGYDPYDDRLLSPFYVKYFIQNESKYKRMDTFKTFFEGFEQDVKETIDKLPKKFRKLVHGYKFRAEDGCTLKKYPDSVGLIALNSKEKIVKVAAPHYYGREFVILHEIGHLVWEELSDETKEKWKKIFKNTKDKIDQNAEEVFCHAFAGSYCKHPPKIHHHDEWVKFIKAL